MSGQTKLVLCATAQNLLAGVWNAGKLQSHQRFANDDAGHTAFAEFLNKHPSTPVYLIADAVEEDYRLETVPHTSGSARRELVERKLNQFYRGLDYRTAHFVNRELDKRKDDKFLFAALNNAEFLQGWVAVIQQVEAHLVGLYLLPMLSQVIVRQLKMMAPHILLCEKLSSGLRQTYLHNGRLRMSRLVSNIPAATNQLGYFYLVETEKTRLYLISQRYITRETPLNLALVSVDGSTQHISQGISQEQGIECTDVNLTQFAKTLGLPTVLLEEAPELLHMQLLANNNLVDNLAPATLTKQYQFSKLTQAIKIGTIVLGAIGLAITAGVAFQAWMLKSDLEQAVQDTKIQQRKYDEVASNFPVTTIPATELQLAVELDKSIEANPKSPRRTMQVLSTALEKSPEIQLNRLRWTLTNDISLKDDDKSISVPPPASNLPVAPPAMIVDPTKLYELAFMTAEISGFTGDYRGALNSVNRFVAQLKADKRVALVEVLQEPVNVSSFVDLQGSTTDEQSTQRQPALFKLKVVLQLPELVTDTAVSQPSTNQIPPNAAKP